MSNRARDNVIAGHNRIMDTLTIKLLGTKLMRERYRWTAGSQLNEFRDRRRR